MCGTSPSAVLDMDAGEALEGLSLIYQALEERQEDMAERMHQLRTQGSEPGFELALIEIWEALIGG